MLPLASELKRSYEHVLSWQKSAASLKTQKDKFPVVLNVSEQLRRANRGDLSLDLLLPWRPVFKNNPDYQFALALAYRDTQSHKNALKAINRAVSTSHPAINHLHAAGQIKLESWREDAARDLRVALKKDPNNFQIIKDFARALACSAEFGEAENLLEAALEDQPDWLEGLEQLSVLRHTSGQDDYDRANERAVLQAPDHIRLRLAWFQNCVKHKKWNIAKEVLDSAVDKFGDHKSLVSAKCFFLAETQSEISFDDLFEPVQDLSDPGLDICRVRYALKQSTPELALSICEAYIKTDFDRAFWPYISLCWRLLDDKRFSWLERDGDFIKTLDLGLFGQELAELKTFLISLHEHQRYYPEQSVRNGSQTDRNLLLAHFAEIKKLRHHIADRVREYISSLPDIEPEHPFLRHERDIIKFAGSWSVLLRGAGYHSDHTHTQGWISSASYISVPDPEARGPELAGYLRFGAPPPELGLPLEPYKWVKPERGKLVLFPSFIWHGTEPILKGQRLTVAFDVM